MGIGWKQSLACLTKDSRALFKLGIGGAAAVFPIIGFVTPGFLVAMYRNVVSCRPDDQVLPEWEEFGDFFFKGISASAIAFCYSLVFLILFLVVALFTSISFFLSAVNGEHSSGMIFFSILAVIALFGFGVTAGGALSYYCETLEIGSAFRFADVAGRIISLGKDYYKVMAAWACGLGILWFLTSFLPAYVSALVFSILAFSLTVVIVNIVGQLVESEFKPEISDPMQPKLLAPTSMDIPVEPEEDEYGYAKPGHKKASAYATHMPDSTLTWSTDSDEAE